MAKVAVNMARPLVDWALQEGGAVYVLFGDELEIAVAERGPPDL